VGDLLVGVSGYAAYLELDDGGVVKSGAICIR